MNASIEKKEFNLINLIKLYFKHKVFIIGFTFIFLVGVLGYSYIAPVEYEAMATIMPPDEGSGGQGLAGFLQSLQGEISIGGMGKGNKTLLLSEFLKSREVAKYIAEKHDLYNSPYFEDYNKEALYSFISSLITFKINRSGVIVLMTEFQTGYFPAKEDKDFASKFSAELANTAIEGIDHISREKSVSKARKKGVFISKMLERKKKELDSVDAALESFRKEHKVIEIQEQTQALLTGAVNVGYDLAKAEIDLMVAKQEFNPNSSAIMPYIQQVESLKDQYRKMQSGGLGGGDDFSIPFKKVPELIREYTNLMRDQKILVQVNLYLETQKYQEMIQEESDIPTVEALDAAVPPLFKSAPNRMIMLIIGFVLAMFFSLSWVTFRAMWKGHVYLRQEQA